MIEKNEKAGFLGIATAVCIYVVLIVLIVDAILFIGNFLGGLL